MMKLEHDAAGPKERMGGMGLVGVGGPGERGEHNPLDTLAYTVHEWTYDSA
jgi:hypothetical protein